MKNLGILLIIFLIANLILPISVLAQVDAEDIRNIVSSIIGVESDWLTFPAVIYNVIVPFIAFFAVTLGLLRELRIYRNQPNIEMVLAFIIAFSTLPLGVFAFVVTWSLLAMGFFAYGIFIFLFFVGGYFFTRNRLSGYRGEGDPAKAYKSSLEHITKELTRIGQDKANLGIDRAGLIQKVDTGVIKTRTQKEKMGYQKKLSDLDKKMADLNDRERDYLNRVQEIQRAAGVTN